MYGVIGGLCTLSCTYCTCKHSVLYYIGLEVFRLLLSIIVKVHFHGTWFLWIKLTNEKTTMFFHL